MNLVKTFRVAAAGIVLHENKVLLVRYKNSKGQLFLVGPGGGVEASEDLAAGLIREVYEETGLIVKVGKLLLVEDLLAHRYRAIKFWFLCNIKGGTLTATEEAVAEGIVDVGWFSRQQLQGEVVYPRILLEYNWQNFESDDWQVQYAGLQRADF